MSGFEDGRPSAFLLLALVALCAVWALLGLPPVVVD